MTTTPQVIQIQALLLPALPEQSGKQLRTVAIQSGPQMSCANTVWHMSYEEYT